MLLKGHGDTAASKAGVSYIAQWTGEGDRAQHTFFDYESRAMESRVILHLKAGIPQEFTVITSCVPGALHHEPHLQAIRMIKLALWEGFDALRDKNRAAWQEIWKGRVTLKAKDDKWQDWLDSAFFYLNTTLHTSTPFSIAPCGLGHRFLYKGHVFWDTESFMLMPALLTSPEVAEALLTIDLTASKLHAITQGSRAIAVSSSRGRALLLATRSRVLPPVRREARASSMSIWMSPSPSRSTRACQKIRSLRAKRPGLCCAVSVNGSKAA